MKKFLQEHGLWVLFATAVIAVALAVMSFYTNTSAPLTNLVNSVSAPFRSAYTSVATWFNDKQAYYQDSTALAEENAALKVKIAKMEAAVRQAQSDSAENKRLRELANLREQRQDFVFEAATVTEHSTSNWTASLTLNRGTDHGVTKNDCVITEEGFLVGVISEVGGNWCRVLLVTDTDTSIGAQVFRTKDLGLAQGDFSLMDKGALQMSVLAADATLLNGDLIVTSGLGGYYPAGLVIGSVDEVKQDDSGATSYAVLSPSADLNNLIQVFIIKSFEIVD
ncbi:MAG: rod shape-determining protein MreC [Oscillibacter sp.]